MALNLKNPEVEALVAQVAAMTGESKTEAVRQALLMRRRRLRMRGLGRGRAERFTRFLESDVWPHVPPEQLGRPLTRAEEDAILGYGAEGL